HGIWGLWQMGLAQNLPHDIRVRMGNLLTHHDPEIRAQSARVLGDVRVSAAEKRLLSLLADPSGRVRYFAAEALGKLKSKAAISGILDLLEVVGVEDRTEIYAISLALSRILPPADLVQLGQSARGRMAIVLALRHQAAPELLHFVNDSNPTIVHEAIRAIHDLPVPEALPQLADFDSQLSTLNFPLAHRILNANFRLGTKRHALRVATFASNTDLSTEIRLEALKSLEQWGDPSPFDRVTWHHRPITTKRDSDIGPVIADSVRQYLFGTRNKNETKHLQVAARLAIKYDLIPVDSMDRLARDTTLDETTRLAFLHRLLQDADQQRIERITRLLVKDKSVPIRLAAARPLLEQSDTAAQSLVTATWKSKTLTHRQAVIRTLAGVDTPFAVQFLSQQIGHTNLPTALDTLQATRLHPNPQLKRRAEVWLEQLRQHPDAEYNLTLTGGDKTVGKRLFATHAIQCVRCHQIKGFGGDAGPELTKIGRTLKPDQLLQSLINPSARIAEGFGTYEFEIKNDEPIAGFIRSEDDQRIQLTLMDARQITLRKDQITRRSNPTSAMPTMRDVLTPTETRHLIAYLASLK
ncbi:MAG: HEAT repeat domain-containing protein, partial [Limisphaerales bacterium]